jgi:hypothetical protein
MRKLIAGSCIATVLSALSVPAMARTEVDFFVNVPPPAAPVEVVPAPRAGWVWIPGFYEWRGHHHFWVRGHWARERRGYVYAPARWVERDGRWYYTKPAWRRY